MAADKKYPFDDQFPDNVNPTPENRKEFSDRMQKQIDEQNEETRAEADDPVLEIDRKAREAEEREAARGGRPVSEDEGRKPGRPAKTAGQNETVNK